MTLLSRFREGWARSPVEGDPFAHHFSRIDLGHAVAACLDTLRSPAGWLHDPDSKERCPACRETLLRKTARPQIAAR